MEERTENPVYTVHALYGIALMYLRPLNADAEKSLCARFSFSNP
jgi:hypothetical protein